MTDKHRVISLAEYRNGRIARPEAGTARETNALADAPADIR